ncbi:MAG TPA: Ig-like domain repeat protein, partial [Solirubrobacterales bacterium]|nr:Ig-like domain repeat protein [Solirubrobacterales bacterium]
MAVAVLAAADAKAAYYKMVACSHTNGAPPFSVDTNTRSSANPNGIFHIWNWCDGQGGDPPGDGAFLRIQEHQNMPHTAGENAYGNFIFDTPSYVHFKQAGGYTRQPASFHDGWRSRFWVASCCSTAEILSQKRGGGLTSTFAPHLWPYGGTLWDFNRFVFELRCVRPGRCDVSGDVKTDLNGLVFLLSDDSDSRVDFTKTSADFLAGRWVRGTHNVTFDVRDQGSGIRAERMLIDGALRWNHNHSCSTSWTGQNGEWARSYSPCPTGGPWGRSVGVDTATLSDGSHTVRLCTEDYGQYQGLHGTKGETCTQRTVRTDNTAPGKPAALQVTSKNPNRYLDRFGAQWTLPPDSGSPIKTVHYDVIDAQGKVVMAERTASGTNPTSLAEIQGPERRGAYWMRVWLEDEVGNVGPAAGVEIPRDTTPPAAPQELRIAASSTERWVERFGLRWRNIVDAGAPIDEAHYQVLDGSGEVVVPTRSVSEQNVQEVSAISSPSRRGDYVVRIWLSDAEGNVGAAASVPLPRDTTPPAAPQSVSVAAPDASRAAEGFDLRWRNIGDQGSPIAAAHYKVINGSGGAVVPATTAKGEGIERIA